MKIFISWKQIATVVLIAFITFILLFIIIAKFTTNDNIYKIKQLNSPDSSKTIQTFILPEDRIFMSVSIFHGMVYILVKNQKENIYELYDENGKLYTKIIDYNMWYKK